MYIANNSISSLVAYKLQHPDLLFVSANIVNHPKLQEIHNARLVPQPFAPEQSSSPQSEGWKIGDLPFSPLQEVLSFSDDWPPPPEYKHRWLPMRGATIDDCPIRNGLSCSGQPKWQCAAIAHYSFFRHLETSIAP